MRCGSRPGRKIGYVWGLAVHTLFTAIMGGASYAIKRDDFDLRSDFDSSIERSTEK